VSSLNAVEDLTIWTVQQWILTSNRKHTLNYTTPSTQANWKCQAGQYRQHGSKDVIIHRTFIYIY